MSTINRRTVLGMAGVSAAAIAAAGAGILSSTGLFQGEAQAAEGLEGVNDPTFTALTPFRDPLRVPPTLRPQGTTEIDLVASYICPHSQMPPIRLWTYGGHLPGPTIECAAASGSASRGTTS